MFFNLKTKTGFQGKEECIWRHAVGREKVDTCNCHVKTTLCCTHASEENTLNQKQTKIGYTTH